MRCRLTLGLIFSAVILTSVSVYADDNVIVDLSVLDELAPATAPAVRPQPLFPVVKKASKVKKATPKKTKSAKKTSAPSKVKVTVKETLVESVKEVATPQNEPVATEDNTVSNATSSSALPQQPELEAAQPVAEVVAVEGDTNERPVTRPIPAAQISPQAQDNSNREKAPADPSQVIVEEEQIIVVESEPVTASQSTTDNVAVEDQKNMAPGENAEVSDVLEPQPIVPAVASEEADSSRPLIDPVDKDDIQPAPTAQAVSPVLPATATPHQLHYSADVSDLTAEQQIQIDRIIAGFKDPQNNKIAIFAYNLDDGVDTFRKKRLSLSRAVEIRSYLLQKGYKNFSIKVINIAAGSDKADVVEIEEM